MIRLTSRTSKPLTCDHCKQQRQVRRLLVNEVPLMQLCWNCLKEMRELINQAEGQLSAAATAGRGR
jgi:hypothetical protein